MKKKEPQNYKTNADLYSASVALVELNINKDSQYGFENIKSLEKTLINLVLYTPTYQSHLGKKLKDYSWLSNKNLENKIFANILQLFSIAENNVFLFKTVTPRTNKRIDISKRIIAANEPILVLKCDNGLIESFFSSIRNSIAHGNLVFDGNYYIFYSIEKENYSKEYSSKVTFFLRTAKVRNLNKLFGMLDFYDHNTE